MPRAAAAPVLLQIPRGQRRHPAAGEGAEGAGARSAAVGEHLALELEEGLGLALVKGAAMVGGWVGWVSWLLRAGR